MAGDGSSISPKTSVSSRFSVLSARLIGNNGVCPEVEQGKLVDNSDGARSRSTDYMTPGKHGTYSGTYSDNRRYSTTSTSSSTSSFVKSPWSRS